MFEQLFEILGNVRFKVRSGHHLSKILFGENLWVFVLQLFLSADLLGLFEKLLLRHAEVGGVKVAFEDT